jgi:hypothetical protein
MASVHELRKEGKRREEEKGGRKEKGGRDGVKHSLWH